MRITRFIAALVLTLALAGCSAAEPEGTGETTTVQVSMVDMAYVPDVIEVPRGNRLVIEVSNEDAELHDLVLETGPATERFGQGKTETLDAGIITEDIEGWCSVPPHREMGMTLDIVAID
ncbi:MAG: cupredoxin domain-containing protein [Salinibacterium sp.]|nr:cupredoxin domain-containing protein [Salinibacterium sp.]MBF0672173.1 cupredoxin domain-containing protein [Salinibacterium sp.]